MGYFTCPHPIKASARPAIRPRYPKRGNSHDIMQTGEKNCTLKASQISRHFLRKTRVIKFHFPLHFSPTLSLAVRGEEGNELERALLSFHARATVSLSFSEPLSRPESEDSLAKTPRRAFIFTPRNAENLYKGHLTGREEKGERWQDLAITRSLITLLANCCKQHFDPVSSWKCVCKQGRWCNRLMTFYCLMMITPSLSPQFHSQPSDTSEVSTSDRAHKKVSHIANKVVTSKNKGGAKEKAYGREGPSFFPSSS